MGLPAALQRQPVFSSQAVDPSNARGLRGLATAKLNLNELPDAEAAVEYLARVEPNHPRTHEMRARVHIQRRAYPLATNVAQTMIRLAPRNYLGFHLLAAALLGQKRNREALAAIQEGLKLAPGSATLLAQSGWTKLALKGPPAARADIEEAFRLAPRNRYIRTAAATLQGWRCPRIPPNGGWEHPPWSGTPFGAASRRRFRHSPGPLENIETSRRHDVIT